MVLEVVAKLASTGKPCRARVLRAYDCDRRWAGISKIPGWTEYGGGLRVGAAKSYSGITADVKTLEIAGVSRTCCDEGKNQYTNK